MANLSKTTRDREEIRSWAEARGGKPAHVKGTGSGEDIGILRIEFPGYSGEGKLEPISWEEFFDKFNERNLALIYQEETAEGAKSNFNKLVSAETAAESERGQHAGRPGTSRSKKSAGKRAASRGRSSAAKKSGGSKKSASKRASGGSSSRSAASRRTAKSASKRSGGKKAAKKSSSRSVGRKSASTKKSSTKKRR